MRVRAAALVLWLGLAAATAGEAQAPEALATRADLQRAFDTMTPAQRLTPEGLTVQVRLSSGDFAPGNRITLSVVGDTAFSGTFTVRIDTTIAMPNIDPISLRGVLRSELNPYLDEQMRRYVKNPVVTAHSLISVVVSGTVVRPGYYDLSPESPLSATITMAGGLTPSADIGRLAVRRAGVTIYARKQTATFLASGASLDQLSIQNGDEIRVDPRGGALAANVGLIAAIAGILLAITAVITIF